MKSSMHIRVAPASRPETTFGSVKADVLALKAPTYKRVNFCCFSLSSS